MRADDRKKRNSILLIVGIAVISIILLICYTVQMSGITRPMLQITVGDELFGTYDLQKDQTIRINDSNICEIRNGEVRMTWADCPDQVCVKSKAIDSSGGSIVCMPNRVVLSIVHADETEEDTPDAIAG